MGPLNIVCVLCTNFDWLPLFSICCCACVSCCAAATLIICLGAFQSQPWRSLQLDIWQIFSLERLFFGIFKNINEPNGMVRKGSNGKKKTKKTKKLSMWMFMNLHRFQCWRWRQNKHNWPGRSGQVCAAGLKCILGATFECKKHTGSQFTDLRTGLKLTQTF